MKTLVFNKESGQWFISLPEYQGDKMDLLMVMGADKLLDRLSNGKETISLLVSEEEPADNGFEKITKIMNTPLFGGATYMTKYWPIWLCDVTKFIYGGRMPSTLYYKVI